MTSRKPIGGGGSGGEGPYPDWFWPMLEPRATLSAQVVLPMVFDLVGPRSVVDVGCGMGSWLAVCLELGLADVLGIDGDYVDREMLRIPQEVFRVHDLEHPLRLDRTFDLVISLEVAEHLTPAAAEPFVDSLVALGPVILFSAAIPGQGGIGHVNEQPPHYWAGLFEDRGYVSIDCLRDRIWDEPGVDWWYAQNAVIYASRDRVLSDERLLREWRAHGEVPAVRIHPGRAEEIKRWRHS